MIAQNNNFFLAAATPNPSAGNLSGAATKYGNSAGCAGYNQIAMHKLNFGPRLGFAFSINSNTVVQGGYTITYLGYGGAYGQGEGLSGGPNDMAGLLGASYILNSTGAIPPIRRYSIDLPGVSAITRLAGKRLDLRNGPFEGCRLTIRF